MQLMVKAGSSQDPVGKEGLADFTATMLKKGTTKRAASRVAEDLEQIGGEYGASAEPDYSMISASSLSFYKDDVLKQFSEIILNPSFTNAEIERLRKQVFGGLQKLADRPESFSEHLMTEFLYGHHPYGHEPLGNIHSVAGIKRVDLQKFYSAYYSPENCVMAVVGQYDEAWKKSLVAAFSNWKKKAVNLKEIPDFPVWKGRELLLVDRGDLNQAQIQIGFKGVPRDIPEYMELRAALKVLGESFGSRLFEEIRVKRGLTYHINAWFDPRLKSGPMGIYTFTRVDKIAETVEETLKTYKLFVDGGITSTEMDTVKAYMRGQFPRNFETPEALGTQLLLLNRYGISTDYLTHYLEHLDAMTKDSVNKTIKKYFDDENLRILVYAPKDKAEESLKKLGKLEIKNYKEFLQ
jgi:predicted Zn-dependent peptidase